MLKAPNKKKNKVSEKEVALIEAENQIRKLKEENRKLKMDHHQAILRARSRESWRGNARRKPMRKRS